MTDVIARCDGAAGHLSLNRPKAIHALTLGMVQDMTAALLEWRDDDAVTVILVDHAEGRGFCAGGDIALLRDSALNDGGISGRRFFFDEYRLNHLLFTYPKPVVAFMDGITMGGGVGISAPAKFRVATENTRFAMPETGIGLFPDVGGGWYLSRLAGRLGEYLALTGARLDGAECLWAGLATHHLAAESLPEAKRRIAAGEDIATVLGNCAAVPPAPRIAEHAQAIDRLFAASRYEDILAALAADDGEFARGALATLESKSPQSCKVSLRLLAESRRLNHLCDEMALEYRIGSRVLMRPDFAEGVRALILDKTNDPAWNPAVPAGMIDEMLDAIFAPLPADEEWTPL